MSDQDTAPLDYIANDTTKWLTDNQELPELDDVIRFDPICNPPRVGVRGFIGLVGKVINVWNGAIHVRMSNHTVYTLSKGQIMEFVKRSKDVAIIPTSQISS